MTKELEVGVSQHDRFIETARKLGCDESLAAFDKKLAVVARATRSGVLQSNAHKADHKTEQRDDQPHVGQRKIKKPV